MSCIRVTLRMFGGRLPMRSIIAFRALQRQEPASFPDISTHPQFSIHQSKCSRKDKNKSMNALSQKHKRARPKTSVHLTKNILVLSKWNAEPLQYISLCLPRASQAASKVRLLFYYIITRQRMWRLSSFIKDSKNTQKCMKEVVHMTHALHLLQSIQ